MNYTSVARVKLALGANETADDALLNTLIAASSRAIDRKCTGAQNSNDYFTLAPVNDEVLRNGVVDRNGNLLCWPHKASVSSVSSLAYRYGPLDTWIDISPDNVALTGNLVLAALGLSRTRPWVRISYTGGLADNIDNLPADLIEAATVLSVRYYREVKTGLSDSIGVAELGTLMYTQAWPVRVLDMLQPYIRIVPW